MPAVFIDTAVIMYAAGRDHPLRATCQALMERVNAGVVDAFISTEVVQEIVHRYLSIGHPEWARSVASDALELFAPVLPITHDVLQRTMDLLDRYHDVRARDLVHVATCLEEGIATIVSPDTHFDLVREITRLAPDDAEALSL